MVSRNPYNYNLPVSPDMFYGRNENVETLINQLTAVPGDSIALIGGRRMGKTSILEALMRHLDDLQIEPKNKLIPISIFLDFSGEGVESPHDFFNRIIEEMEYKLFDVIEPDNSINFARIMEKAPPGPAFRRLLESWGRAVLHKRSIRLRFILLLDECEQIVEQTWVTDLYGALRYLLVGQSTRPLMKVVMTGSHRFLTQVRQTGSPLRNILQYHRLQAFDEDSTRALITEPTETKLDETIVAAILSESGGHPFLAQYLMHNACEQDLSTIKVEDLRCFADEFPQGRSDFSDWLNGLGASGLLAYKTLAQAQDPKQEADIRRLLPVVPPDIGQALDALCYHGLVIHDQTGVYRISANMFLRWFMRNYVPEYEEIDISLTDAETSKNIQDSTVAKFEHGYALLIGVGADLPVTVKDASGLRDILVDSQRCAYPEQQVNLLTRETANRQGILDGLDWLQKKVKADPQATAVVYFSGHGGRTLSDYFLVPYGYDPGDVAGTAVSGAEFTDKLRALKAQKLLVLLDCCHAGGMAEAKMPGFIKSPMPPELDGVLTSGSGRVVIASSRKDELSYTGTPYSIFTQALREGLAGLGAANRDGYAYIADIALYVGRVVPNRTKDRQHPILKLAAADNFAVSYYAGGDKAVQPLEDGLATPLPVDRLNVDIVAGYQQVLKKYQANLLRVETRMAKFYDQAAVPLDLERTKEGILLKIQETEQKIQTEAEKSGWQPTSPMPITPTLEDILHRIDSMETSLGNKLDDLKRGQRIIYQHIKPIDQAAIETILVEVRQNRIEQGIVQNTLDAIRRSLKYIQTEGLPIDDAEIEQALANIYREVVSDLDFHQQLELSLPVVPFLLDYKLSLGAGVDLGAVWQDLVSRIRQ